MSTAPGRGAVTGGPIVLGKLSTLADFDYEQIARAAVDGFLATHSISATNTGSAGA